MNDWARGALDILALCKCGPDALGCSFHRLYSSPGGQEFFVGVRDIEGAGKTDCLEPLIDPSGLAIYL
jgi:hypothetical protein